MSTLNRKDFKKREPKTAMQKRLRYYYKGGRQLYRDVSYLKGLINTEFKFKDTSASTQVIGNTSATAHYALLNGLSRGTDANQRVGRSIKLKSVQLQATIRLNDACAATTENNVRVLLVMMKDPEGIAPTYSGSTFRSIYLTDSISSMRDLNNRGKFYVLKQWYIALNAEGVKSRNIKFYKKMNTHQYFNAQTNGDIGDITSNALYLIAIGDLNNANPDETWISYQARIRFIDN